MASVPDAEVLWRRVAVGQREPSTGEPFSSAFKTKELCVHRAALTSLEAVVANYPNDHVYEFTVAQAKEAGATDVDDTLQAGDGPDHAIVQGTTKGKCSRKLRDLARRIYPDAI